MFRYPFNLQPKTTKAEGSSEHKGIFVFPVGVDAENSMEHCLRQEDIPSSSTVPGEMNNLTCAKKIYKSHQQYPALMC